MVSQKSQDAGQSGGTLMSELLSVPNIPMKGTEGYRLVRRGATKLLDELLRSAQDAPKIDKQLVTDMIAEIDRRLSAQIDEILHHPKVQRLESAWRGVKYVVDRADFGRNVAIDLVSVTKEELKIDFEDAPDVTQSGFYATVYKRAFGTLGGKPYGVVCTTFEVSHDSEDVAMLKQMAAVGAMAHVPVLVNAAPRLFRVESFADLGKVKDVQSIFEGPLHSRWSALRDAEDARFLGVCMPRFLLRGPYGDPVNVPEDSTEYVAASKRGGEDPVTGFSYSESVIERHERYLWGPASLAMTARIAESFARYGWCPNIVGPQGGGAVEGLPLHIYERDGALKTKCPVEYGIDDRLERELAEQGLMGMVFRKHSADAAFMSAQSLQRPAVFPRSPEGQAAQRSATIGAQLPYVFVISRIAHYMKVLQREQIGSWQTRADLERELNQWIRGYVADMADPSPETRARKPLRRAKITVEEVPGQLKWYRCGLVVEPHFKLDGLEISLGLVGKLDRA